MVVVEGCTYPICTDMISARESHQRSNNATTTTINITTKVQTASKTKHTENSSQHSPTGERECNACGVHRKRHGEPRPLDVPVRRRHRVSRAPEGETGQ